MDKPARDLAAAESGGQAESVAGRLGTYRRKRDPARTPEPVPAADAATPLGNDDTFVVQEHHARALHWDFRLERHGVLVSWAVPKGLPTDPKQNHLAVHTEDHPLDYAGFAGDIPAGEYGGGSVAIWDRGTYRLEKWTDREVKIVLTGQRVSGRYVLIHTGGKNWIMHRMDPPPQEDFVPLPAQVSPMLATPGELPPAKDDEQWAYETKWDGVRAVVYVDGGRVRVMSRNDRDVSVSYPELRALGEALGSTRAVLDGEIVAFSGSGTTSFSRLQKRMHVTKPADAQRLAESDPAVYLIFDLLYLDGQSTVDLPYTQRRKLLEGLKLSGVSWQSPQHFVGGGAELLRAGQEHGLEGIVAKRLTSKYRPGKRSPDWRKIKNIRTQEVVIVGWTPGKGRREGGIGALLMAVPDENGLVYVGNVGTGFTDAMLDQLHQRLVATARKTSPLAGPLSTAEAKDVHFVTPRLVGEVAFTEWTPDNRIRHPAWRGLRPDKTPDQVVRES
ncbi:MAG: non-homologous end-joining DNA ligase [Actinomycetota bacterium]|nr:non-homologous end-joining DNA ligase [Actinomycetota bacterium]MDQ2956512.1 non-homologous end-joining DNA ligase [Actinomycetota bacterium]